MKYCNLERCGVWLDDVEPEFAFARAEDIPGRERLGELTSGGAAVERDAHASLPDAGLSCGPQTLSRVGEVADQIRPAFNSLDDSRWRRDRGRNSRGKRGRDVARERDTVSPF